MTEVTDFMQLWMDHTHPTTTLARIRPPRINVANPPTVITAPRRSWRENVEARVRVALERMFPEDRLVVEGVSVFRTTAMKEGGTGLLVYQIGSKNVRSLDNAVKAVLDTARARDREAG